MGININEVLLLETELKTQGETAPSASLDAKVNLLKYLQVQAVLQYQAEYDALCYELNRDGGLECLRRIPPVQSKTLLQPKILELQECGRNEQLEEQLKFYLAEATLAKTILDELVTTVANDSRDCEVQCVSVKSLESTRRKASRFCGGDVRQISDMARVTVICDTPEALERVYTAIMECPQVSAIRTLTSEPGIFKWWRRVSHLFRP